MLKNDPTAKAVFYSRNRTKESFADFLARAPQLTAGDFTIWEALDELYGERYARVRRRYHQAGAVVRLRQDTFGSYLRSLEETIRHSRAELAGMATADELCWIAWVRNDYEVELPRVEQLDDLLITWLGLSWKEAVHAAALLQVQSKEQRLYQLFRDRRVETAAA